MRIVGVVEQLSKRANLKPSDLKKDFSVPERLLLTVTLAKLVIPAH